ncbi:PREDICTED: 39S ribosomal protein L33, mitochondrial isoform X1 [Chinchilla lanigera]|uniref:39S ribosomal protein L33, mitochondrial isoform X1 n=1 Tax=Chinchilla lanigera TaxID=34839 RepID=UPI00038EEAC4|nr:PREDICTED: 39S ribosomal protein L33, mitochondrial isoform X1 [Chinchilla lanigera]
MFLSAVALAKSKSKTLLVKMVSQAGTGITFNARRGRLREKLTLLHYDPIGIQPRALCALRKCCSTELRPFPKFLIIDTLRIPVKKKVLFVEQKKIRSL